MLLHQRPNFATTSNKVSYLWPLSYHGGESMTPLELNFACLPRACRIHLSTTSTPRDGCVPIFRWTEFRWMKHSRQEYFRSARRLLRRCRVEGTTCETYHCRHKGLKVRWWHIHQGDQSALCVRVVSVQGSSAIAIPDTTTCTTELLLLHLYWNMENKNRLCRRRRTAVDGCSGLLGSKTMHDVRITGFLCIGARVHLTRPEPGRRTVRFQKILPQPLSTKVLVIDVSFVVAQLETPWQQ